MEWGIRTGVEYHSYEWGCLVEQGFVTMFVENGLAIGYRKAYHDYSF